ncbi:hypothetical protein SAMN04487909_15619 [Aneurinibacillus migulanus]|uniref:Uncharacterized protein n=1 Tax=Aneurinibacillus migulanus TaxID=47500 RepID=A0A1G9C0S3_ANEMI|nr:hypothetical protein SAMN04487909_15619 [Aneurinibacillus migulanus]
MCPAIRQKKETLQQLLQVVNREDNLLDGETIFKRKSERVWNEEKSMGRQI